MKGIIIACVFLISQAYSNPINAKCDQNTFGECSDTFAMLLDLPKMPTDATVLDKQIKKILADGAEGQKKVCFAYTYLQGCLDDQYDACINVDFLQSIGESDKDAQLFVSLAKQLKNTCKAIFRLATINAKCDQNTFGECSDTFAMLLDLPKMPTDATDLDKQIKKILADGAEGQKKVCFAYTYLQGCLDDQYDACINVDFLKSIGESDKDAQLFVTIAQQLKNTCKAQTNFAAAISTKCDPQRFDKCTNDFAKALGLPEMPTDATVLDNQIKKLLADGPAGKEKVCKAAGDLQTCLADQYDSCISVDFLKSIGESDKDAQLFVSLAKQLVKTCTA